MKLSFVLSSLCCILGSSSVQAFGIGITAPRTRRSMPNKTSSRSLSALKPLEASAADKNTLSPIVVAILFGVSTMCSVNVDPALAAPGADALGIIAGGVELTVTSPQTSSLSSSSFNLAKTITTMDMSLPSAYDKISSATASGTTELTVETDTITQTSRKKVSAPSTKSDDSSGSSSSIFSLPSMGGNNDNSLSDEERAALAAEKKAEREAVAIAKSLEREAISAEKAAEREAIASEKAAEKEALALQKAEDNERLADVRALERAEKKAAAAKAAKINQEEKIDAKASALKFNKADFVDFAMPSYDAGASGQKDSVFSL